VLSELAMSFHDPLLLRGVLWGSSGGTGAGELEKVVWVSAREEKAAWDRAGAGLSEVDNPSGEDFFF